MPQSSLYGMPARYLANPPALNDGDAVPLRVDQNGALIVNTSSGITPSQQTYTPTDYVATRSIDAGSADTLDVAEVLATLIADLKSTGIIQ